MNYCIYLKKRKNKPYCKLVNEEIPFSLCRECNNKEYKSDIKISNNNQIRKHTQSLTKTTYKNKKMYNKSNKLCKLEKNRFSVFTDNKDKCMFCPSTTNLTWHEIYRGRNRQNSMRYGFCLRVCLYCHEEKQEDIEFNEYWHRQAQEYFEEIIGTRDDFIKKFGRNYLE